MSLVIPDVMKWIMLEIEATAPADVKASESSWRKVLKISNVIALDNGLVAIGSEYF